MANEKDAMDLEAFMAETQTTEGQGSKSSEKTVLESSRIKTVKPATKKERPKKKTAASDNFQFQNQQRPTVYLRDEDDVKLLKDLRRFLILETDMEAATSSAFLTALEVANELIEENPQKLISAFSRVLRKDKRRNFDE